MENKRGRREKKKERKTYFITWKSLFLFLLFYNYSFAPLFKAHLKSSS
jgi:hypothetical protein